MEWGRYASSIIILKRKKISYDPLLYKEMTEGKSALHETCVVVLLWCDGLWFSESPLVILWLSALSKCRLGRWKEGEKRFTRLMRLGGPHRVWLRTGCLWGLRRTQETLNSAKQPQRHFPKYRSASGPGNAAWAKQLLLRRLYLYRPHFFWGTGCAPTCAFQSMRVQYLNHLIVSGIWVSATSQMEG